MIADQHCIDFITKTREFGHFSGPSYKGDTCWLASWLAWWLAGKLAGKLAGWLVGWLAAGTPIYV